MTAVVVTAWITGAMGGAPAGAAEPDDPAKTCRTDGPFAESLLPTVEPIVAKYLGVHPKSTTRGIGVAIVAPTPGQPGVARRAVFSCGVFGTDDATPIEKDSRFEIGSESKLFTAVALAQLVNAGTVSLDDTVQSFAPPDVTVPTHACDTPATHPMTLRDLATHNSGLTKDPRNITWHPENDPEGHHRYTRDLLWASFADGFTEPCDAMLASPGEQYHYSNWGFALLGTILADKLHPGTEKPAYAEMAADLVTGPLGTPTIVLEPRPPTADMPDPTCPAAVAAPCRWDNDNAFAGAGGLVSGIDDMATFVEANLGFDTSSAIWPALSRTQQPTGRGASCDTCQGLAWGITPAGTPGAVSPLRVLSKDGGTWGMHSQTYLLPDACWGITTLSSGDESLVVDRTGVTGQVLAALGPTVAADGHCGPTTVPSTTIPGSTSSSVSPTSIAVIPVVTPRFTA